LRGLPKSWLISARIFLLIPHYRVLLWTWPRAISLNRGFWLFGGNLSRCQRKKDQKKDG